MQSNAGKVYAAIERIADFLEAHDRDYHRRVDIARALNWESASDINAEHGCARAETRRAAREILREAAGHGGRLRYEIPAQFTRSGEPAAITMTIDGAGYVADMLRPERFWQA